LHTRSQLGDLLLQPRDLLLVLSALEVTKGRVGLAVQALPGDAALLGVLGDVPVLAQEDGRGTGEAVQRRYHTHG